MLAAETAVDNDNKAVEDPRPHISYFDLSGNYWDNEKNWLSLLEWNRYLKLS